MKGEAAFHRARSSSRPRERAIYFRHLAEFGTDDALLSALRAFAGMHRRLQPLFLAPGRSLGGARRRSPRPGLDGIWIQYGHVLRDDGQPDAAEQAYRRALDTAPHNADALFQLGCLKQAQGDTDAARRYFTEALRRDKSLSGAEQALRAIGGELGVAAVL